jgi:hypothetical protein
MKPPTDPSDASDPSDAAIERGLHEGRRLDDAPEHVIQRALAAWQPRRATSLLQQVLAVLRFDSGTAAPLAFGMRSPGAASRQLLFAAQGRDVDLRIGPAGAAEAAWLISGQVLGPDSHGVVVLSGESGALVSEVALDELGQFRLPPVPAGGYTLTLRLADAEITIPALQVPQAG